MIYCVIGSIMMIIYEKCFFYLPREQEFWELRRMQKHVYTEKLFRGYPVRFIIKISWLRKIHINCSSTVLLL